METSWHSYPSIYALGHRAITNLFDRDVIVEEKIDGSQFSFGVFGGEIKCRSKGAQLIVDAPEKMFARAVGSVKERANVLRDGWTYRGEYLQKPKHNTLNYGRVPSGHIIIFDVNVGHEQYLDADAKREEAERIGLECTPLIYSGRISHSDTLRGMMERESVLGGCKIEGVVVKPMAYDIFGQDKKCVLGKYVSEGFKEANEKEWKKSNPTTGDVLDLLANDYKTEARWRKSIQHLAEAGKLTDSPKDIGPLLGEVQGDILAECQDEIKERLFKWAWPHIKRKSVAGLPEWYKGHLLEMQFSEDDAA